jgi:AcrR family transcriptional regulator
VSESVKVIRQERRVRTEAKLLDAFQTVLIREGAGDVTVQAVALEAQVAKTLIYRYFDGIGGLIKAWAKQRDLFVPLEVLFPDPEASAKDLYEDPFQFAKSQILKQAAHMRNQPAYVELCLAELSGSGPVVDALMDLRLERNEAMGLCFVPNTAEDVTIDRTAGNGSIAGSVFLEGVEGQDECLAQNYPDEVCVVRADLASSALTATEAADLESLIAAMPQGNCEPDPNTNGDPCITTGLTFDGTREDNCMGGTQLVEGHGMALKALVAFIDSLAVTKLTR